MLTNHKALEGKLVASWTEPAYRESHDSTRFRFVVDEGDNVLATVTKRYTLVQNRDLVAALDLAASDHDIIIEPTRAAYRNGRSIYKFQVPGLQFTAPGDPSVTKAGIILQNDYKGSGGLVIGAGLYRKACTNDLTIGRVAHVDTLRHVGAIDVYAFVKRAITKLLDEFDINRLLAESLAHEKYPNLVQEIGSWHSRANAQDVVRAQVENGQAVDLVASIMADTPDRYHRAIREAVGQDTRDMGENLWALAQSIARVATHDMPAIETATTWGTRQLNRVREFANV